MLAALATFALGFSLPVHPRARATMHHVDGLSHAQFAKLYCEDEYNPKTGRAEEVCVVPPYQADQQDMDFDGCYLLGGTMPTELTPPPFFSSHAHRSLCTDYPAPGAGTRWACPDRMGANAEEEWVDGALRWVHYVRP